MKNFFEELQQDKVFRISYRLLFIGFVLSAISLSLLARKQQELIQIQNELITKQEEYIQNLKIKSSDMEDAYNQCVKGFDENPKTEEQIIPEVRRAPAILI